MTDGSGFHGIPTLPPGDDDDDDWGGCIAVLFVIVSVFWFLAGLLVGLLL